MNMLDIVLVIAAAGALAYAYLAQRKLREAVDIKGQVDEQTSFWRRTGLRILGLKTPLANAASAAFGFLAYANDQLQVFPWAQFLSQEKAAIASAFFFFVGLWTHFSGLNKVAAMTPVEPK